MRRVVIPELLDTDAGSPDEIKGSLADLRDINRRFGGIATMCSLVERIAAQTGVCDVSLLDVGAGSGDVAEQTRRLLAHRGIRLSYTLLDAAVSHLNGYRPGVVANALALPFKDRSFDLVACSLFLHHLEPDEIRAFIEDALRVSRIAVLINDLRRSPVHLGLVYAGFPLFRSRLTRHDAPASVRRAYRESELRHILSACSAAQVDITRHYLYRIGVIAWKHATAKRGEDR
jgi:SAM-dependent methyltransferase